MPTTIHLNRRLQILAWAVTSIFLLGFFFPLLGAWTGSILGVWFVGTQRPWRGFLLQTAIVLLLSASMNWRTVEYAGWMVFVAVLVALPLLFHRLVSPRLPGFLSTLPLPFAGAALQTLAVGWLPPRIFSLYSLADSQKANAPLKHIATVFGTGAVPFLVLWFAAAVVWMWNEEFRASRIALGASLLAGVFVLAAVFGAVLPPLPLGAAAWTWIGLGGAAVLAIWALSRPGKRGLPWAGRPELALLESPYTRSALHVVTEDGRETLVSPSGERFPIRDGIPVFLKPEEITGKNRKYNRLYETIGGFYDDFQRVIYALGGMEQETHFLSYLPMLEIKPGDSVLETSVGTGLNFKYLPRGIKLFGLDLSPEMLARCEGNLRRWRLDADLFLGNAESLPFADASLDVVFHVGGINFFSDRAKAIHEMIRVAKPGSRILIADETEEHVKEMYERMPITGAYFKGRQEEVAAPIDLAPPEMQEIHLELLLNGRFYVLTFRKPVNGE